MVVMFLNLGFLSQLKTILDKVFLLMYDIHQMLRTQIYFPRELYQDLKTGATVNNLSLSEYIRRIIREKLYATAKKIKIPTKRGRLSVLAKNAISFGKRDLAKKFDEYLESSF